MKATIELSMYPFTPDYEGSILDFIHRLNQYPNLEVHTNSMSTQVFGEYETLMSILTKEIGESFQEDRTTVVVMKILNVSPEK